MNTTIIIIGFIAIAVSVIWGTKFKTNVGIAALVFAFVLGLFGLGMKAYLCILAGKNNRTAYYCNGILWICGRKWNY